MNLDYILIDNKNELLKYKTSISELFDICFNRKMNEATWQWEYIDNPCGGPIVSLCFNDEGRLVGHYAVIPFP